MLLAVIAWPLAVSGSVRVAWIRDVSFRIVSVINERIDRAASQFRVTSDAEIERADRQIEDAEARSGR
jgi:hypothetical protein